MQRLTIPSNRYRGYERGWAVDIDTDTGLITMFVRHKDAESFEGPDGPCQKPDVPLRLVMKASMIRRKSLKQFKDETQGAPA